MVVFQLETGYLQHVFDVFERVGYETGDGLTDWTVLWSHVYPFSVLSRYTLNLKPHQKVSSTIAFNCLTEESLTTDSN